MLIYTVAMGIIYLFDYNVSIKKYIKKVKSTYS